MNLAWKRNGLVLIFFVLLTIIVAWSLLENLNGAVIGFDIDALINPWADWWTWRALTEPNQSLWYTDMLFYPYGANLVFHSFSHLNTAVALALTPIAGPIPAYNLAILLNYALSGLAMYQLVYYLTRSNTAGLLAGIIFAFNSLNQFQGAHPVLVSIWCLPWVTLGFFHAVRENSVKWAIFTAVMVAAGAFASSLLLVMMGLWLLFLVIYFSLSSAWPQPPWRILFLIAGLSALLILPLVFPVLRDAFLNNNTTFNRDPAQSIIADALSILLPHWIYWYARAMYIGIVTLWLVIIAIWSRRGEVGLWLWLVVIAYLFAIGPQLHIAGQDTGITLPWSYLITPTIRNPYRMMVLFSMGVSVLAAYGWLSVAERIQTRQGQQLVAVLLILAIFWDYTIGDFPATAITISPFYTDFLEDVPDEVVLATLPYGRQPDKNYLLYQPYHGHKITGGVISRASEPTSLIERNAILRAGMVDEEPVALPEDWETPLRELADLNIGYLVLHKTLMETEEWEARIPLTPVYEDELVVAYALDARP